MRDNGFLYLHPGVEALGYVKTTTPALLSSTRALRLVLTPSLVSTSPPKPSSEMMSPTWGLPVTGKPLVAGASAGAAGASAGAALGGRPRGLTASLTFAATLATLDCFFAAGGSGGGAGALRLRSSTGISAMGGGDSGGLVCDLDSFGREGVKRQRMWSHREGDYVKVMTGGWKMWKMARWMEKRRFGAWVDVRNINRTSKRWLRKTRPISVRVRAQGPARSGGRRWIAVGTWGETGRRGRAEMDERPSEGRDAAWSPELPGYLDRPDHSPPFPCIVETIEVAHNHPSDAASHRTRANELRREAGPGGHCIFCRERSWIIESSTSPHQPWFPCCPSSPNATDAYDVFLLDRLARGESAEKASRHASHV